MQETNINHALDKLMQADMQNLEKDWDYLKNRLNGVSEKMLNQDAWELLRKGFEIGYANGSVQAAKSILNAPTLLKNIMK